MLRLRIIYLARSAFKCKMLYLDLEAFQTPSFSSGGNKLG